MKTKIFMCILLAGCLLLPGLACARFGRGGLSPGDPRHFNVDNIRFTMRYAPAATFPIGRDDSEEATVADPFWIGETEVTYELWYKVRTWAEENGYSFANQGQEGGQLGDRGKAPSDMKNHPVTRINWFDKVVWCNALSEYLDLKPLYYLDGEIHRNAATKIMFDLELRPGTGFRLPTNIEWELAARYRGKDRSGGAIEYPQGSGTYWTPGNYASGATGPFTDEEATMAAAWFNANSAPEGNRTTHTRPVGQKPARGNTLNLFDMSGNVHERMHDYELVTHRGGCYYFEAENLSVGMKEPGSGTEASRFSTYPNLGFRLVLPTEPGRLPETIPTDDSDPDEDEEPTGTDPPDDEDPDLSQPDPDEAVFQINSLVEARYGTVWYPAVILEVQAGEFFITYIGYEESWDEWVGPDRLRNFQEPPMIASVESATVSVDLNADLTLSELPDKLQIRLQNGLVIDTPVSWDLSGLDTHVEGEFVLRGQYTRMPANIMNWIQFPAALTVLVRDPDSVFSMVRSGENSGVEDLLFYVERENHATGYYYGLIADFDLTHLVIENPDKSFAAMIVFDENLVPIQWVFPDLTIAILVDRGESFDPGQARHSFLFEESQEDLVFDITLSEPAIAVLERLPDLFGDEADDLRTDLAKMLNERGWLTLPVSTIIEEAESPHDLVLASMLSIVSIYSSMIDGLDSLEADPTGQSGSSDLHQIVRLDQLQIGHFAASPVFIENLIRRLLTGNAGPVFDMVTYTWRILTDFYGAGDIEGPAVSMLLCKGVSTVPFVCNEFYFPNTPGNVSRCVSICYTSMQCFTDICHPKMFSAQDAISLRRP